MTGAFMALTNSGDHELTLVSVDCPRAGRVELHETVMSSGQSVMAPKVGGIPVPGGQTVALAPGGDHVMLMELPEPLAAGDEVEMVLHFSDGTAQTVRAPVKAFSGAGEHYHGSASPTMPS